MKRLLVVALIASILMMVLAVPANAGERTCYLGKNGGLYATDTTCAVARAVRKVVLEKRYSGLIPFRIHGVHGSWRCEPYVYRQYRDVICRSGRREVGVGVRKR